MHYRAVVGVAVVQIRTKVKKIEENRYLILLDRVKYTRKIVDILTFDFSAFVQQKLKNLDIAVVHGHH